MWAWALRCAPHACPARQGLFLCACLQASAAPLPGPAPCHPAAQVKGGLSDSKAAAAAQVAKILLDDSRKVVPYAAGSKGDILTRWLLLPQGAAVAVAGLAAAAHSGTGSRSFSPSQSTK